MTAGGFRFFPLSLASGVAAALGILVLAQQSAVAYPTRSLGLVVLVVMLVLSQLLPNLLGRRAPAAAAAPASPAPPMPTTWAATHHVPDGGLEAWADPDPAQPAVTTLAAGVELRILEQTGDWARVEAANGWTGWVDARRLLTR